MEQEIETLTPEIHKLIEEKQWKVLSQMIREWPAPEIADVMTHQDKADRVLLYRLLPRHHAAQVFSYLSQDDQNTLLHELTDDDARHLLENLSPDDRTALLEELPATVTKSMLRLLSGDALSTARQLLGYPEESVGRLMTPNYLSVRPEWTIAEALEHIRSEGKDSETFNIVYVTDDNSRLLDALRLRRLIMADPSADVESLLNDSVISISAFRDREEAVRLIQRYDIFAIPVVDSEGVMLGIVTVDDVLDVAQEEATEDFHKSAAVSPLDRDYSAASPFFLYRKRIGWLTILVFVSLISSGVIASFEDNLANVIALAFFIPLLIGSGGNAGAQSATLMVRAIATGDLQLDRWARALGKELLVGIALGVTLGAITYILGIFRGDVRIGLVVSLSMASIILVANCLGTVLPFALSRFKLDPAVASSPLITSTMDAIGLLIYFSIAIAILDFT